MTDNCLFRQRRGLLCLLLIFTAMMAAVSGCSKPDEKAVLKERVTAYWQAKISGDLSRMYDLEYPLLKKETSRDKYLEQKKKMIVQYQNPVIQSINLDKSGDSADVKIKVVAGVKPLKAKNTFKAPVVITDHWVKAEDGKWYHVPKNIMKK